MTRRFVSTIVAIVLATLTLVGLGTVGLANVRARATTRDELTSQAVEIATNLDGWLDVDAGLSPTQERAETVRRLSTLRRMTNVLDLDGFGFLIRDRSGQLQADLLPAPLTIELFDDEALAAGRPTDGNVGNYVYAAAPTSANGQRQLIVVVGRQANAALGPSVRLFVLAALATLAIGIGAALIIGRRLSRRLVDIADAARRIANGDLATRLPTPGSSSTTRSSDELVDLTVSINDMAGALQRNRTLEQQFLLSVSHDLRTPLTSIRGYAEAIDDQAIEPRAAAAVIVTEAGRLERLVGDVLDLAKAQSSSFSLRPSVFDLGAAVATAVDAARGLGTAVEIHAIAIGRVDIVADADRTAQVLTNLIANATHFAATTIHVAVRREHGFGIVTVDDDGPGIASDELGKVFDRLYSGRRQPQRREAASGLGLAIVRQLTEAMGGTVAADHNQFGGARFVVALPLASVDGA